MRNPAKDLEVLVHSLCRQRRLPSLVTDLIASNIDNPEVSIITLSTVSRGLQQHAILMIYEEIVIDFSESPSAVQKAVLLLRTLRSNNVAAGAIRTLRLTGKGLATPHRIDFEDRRAGHALAVETNLEDIACWRMSPNWARPMTRRSFAAYLAVPQICLQLMSLSIRLENLDVGCAMLDYPDFREAWSAMRESGKYLGLQALRSCRIGLDAVNTGTMGVYINFAQGWDPALLMPFVAPKIESVSVVMTLALGSIGHFPVSSLTRLVLHHYQYRDCEVSSLLAATPKLRYLEYHALVEHGFSWGPRRDLGLEIVYGALHNISDTLEELVATQIYVSNDNCFEGGYEDWHPQPDLHVENLTSMKCLRSLSLPYMSLLGRTSREASNWEWHKVLPSSLRSLTLTSHLSENECNYEPSWENEDEDLMATFMTLLDWMAVDETRGQQSAFALIFDGLCDQHFPNRQQQQELDLLCKERHIQFSLTKLPWGKYPGQRWPPA